MCASCKIVYYCGKQHQVADWKSHKMACKQLKRSNDLGSLGSDMAAERNSPQACQASRLSVTDQLQGTCDDTSAAPMFYVDTNPDADQDRSASSFWQFGDSEAFSTGDLSSSLLACATESVKKRDSSSSLSSAYSSGGSLHSLGLHHTDSGTSHTSSSSSSLRKSYSSSSDLGLGSSCPSSGSDMTGYDTQGPRRGKILPKQKRLHKDLSQIHCANRRSSHGSMEQNRQPPASDQSNKTLSDYVVKCLMTMASVLLTIL